MNYADLINTITTRIATNGQQAITAQVLQDVLVDMVQEMGQSGALVGGVVDTSYVPDPSNDAQLIYIAQGIGTYPNFGGLTVVDGEVAFFYYDGNAWQKSSVSVNVAVEVIDNLTSTATDKALSANQGRVLDEKKADKVSGATAGNMAGLDADGNLVDSGVPASAVGDVADKIDKVHDAEVGNVPMFKADGGIEDGGVAADNIAEQDGYYETLVAGAAENLIGRGSVPANYTRRRSGGGSIGSGAAVLEEIQGNTLVLNQKILYGDFTSTTGWTPTRGTITVASNKCTYTITQLSTDAIGNRVARQLNFVQGHKYFASFMANIPHNATLSIESSTIGVLAASYNVAASAGTNRAAFVFTANSTQTNTPFGFGVGNTSGNGYSLGEEIVFSNAMVIDLTQMALDSVSTAAEFQSLFPLNYYPYDAGSLLNFTGTGLLTDGFNQLNLNRTAISQYWAHGAAHPFSEDKYIVGFAASDYFNPGAITTHSVNNDTIEVQTTTSGYGLGFPIKCFPSTSYYFGMDVWTGTNHMVAFYDSDGIYISNATANSSTHIFTTPANAYWMVVCYVPTSLNTLVTRTQNIINFDNSARNGEYEPYWSETHTLPITTATSGGVAIFPDGEKSAGGKTDRYYKSQGSDLFDKAEKWIASRAYQAGDESDSTVKTDGTTTYYALSTPTDYTLDTPFSAQYRVDGMGTETLLPQNTATPTTTPIICEVKYPMNAIDTIRNLPQNYISKASMDAILTAFKTAGVITGYTLTWDATNQKYNCTITP